MREDQRFEIERAFDLLPHVAGASWAMIWFRLNKIEKPSREEYRNKVVEYFNLLEPLFESLPRTSDFDEMIAFIKSRKKSEVEKIISGKNPEIERRYQRYIDYG